MVKFNAMNYDCQVTISPSKYKTVYFLFAINLIARTQEKYKNGKRLKFCGIVHCNENELVFFLATNVRCILLKHIIINY